MKKFFIIFFIVFFRILFCDMTFNLDFDYSKNNDEYNYYSVPNYPKIPYKSVKIVIPPGEKVKEIIVNFDNTEKLRNIDLDFNEFYFPLSVDFDTTKKISKKDDFYPEFKYKILGEQMQNGVRILLLNLFPFSYNPISKILEINKKAKISILTSKDDKLLELEKKMYKKTDFSFELLNYEKLDDYNNLMLREKIDSYDMLVISSSELKSTIEPYMKWRNDSGVSTKFASVEDIYNYSFISGRDCQEKIRDYIKLCYKDFNIKYVLLAGDDEIIPDRGTYGKVDSLFIYLQYNIYVTDLPSDLYYSTLDGNWDANNNNIFGEPEDDPDLFPEIGVGRLPIENAEEFENYFHKIKSYCENNYFSDSLAYFWGEDMGWTPQTWGGTYMDELVDYLPDNFVVKKHYEREGNFNKEAVKNAINNGFGIINHLGHCDYNYMFGMYINDINRFDNNRFGFTYTQGCFPAAFDSRTSGGGSGTREAIAEYFITNSSGSFAFIGNTRYGWGQLGSTDGASQAYHHKFMESLFINKELNISKSLNYSRTENVHEVFTIEVMRWVYYGMVLFGDPSINLKIPTKDVPYVLLNNINFIETDNNINDGDNIINPGEEVSILFDVLADENWGDAENISIEILEKDYYEIIKNNFEYNQILSGDSISVENEEFVIIFSKDVLLGEYPVSFKVTSELDVNMFERVYDFDIKLSINQKRWPIEIKQSVNTELYNTENYIFTVSNKGELIKVSKNNNNVEVFIPEENLTIKSDFSVADLNNDGELEFVFTSLSGKVIAISESGKTLFNTEVKGVKSLSIICDIDNNGKKDIIVYDLFGEFYFINNTGEIFYRSSQDFKERLSTSPVIAYENDKTVMYVSTLYNKVYKYDGKFKEILNDIHVIDMAVTHDQKIIFIESNKINIFNNNNIISVSIDNPIHSTMLIKDNNGEETNIIIADRSRNFYLYNSSGYLLARRESSYNFAGNMITADINDDNVEEIIFKSSNRIIVSSLDENIPEKKYKIMGNFTSPLSICDMDEDCDNEILFASSASCLMLNSYDLKTKSGNISSWGHYRGNLYRTGNLRDNIINLTNNNKKMFNLDYSYPNPFIHSKMRNFVMFIPFRISEKGNVKIKIYNIKGQYVSTLTDKIYKSGKNEIIWNGKDKNNNDMSSGVYFIMMEYKNKKQSRKFVLLK